jgi:DNA polymerase III psi subunit
MEFLQIVFNNRMAVWTLRSNKKLKWMAVQVYSNSALRKIQKSESNSPELWGSSLTVRMDAHVGEYVGQTRS